MVINELRLKNFRNYTDKSFSFSRGVNIIYGENAMGKTNIIEAIFLLTGSRSWRAAKKSELVNFETNKAVIEGNITARQRIFQLNLPLPLGKATINGIKVQTQQEMSHVLRCVLFSPEDMGIVRLGAALRRDFLDRALCQMRPRYARCLKEYERVLLQKNKLLKMLDLKPEMEQLLPEYNQKLVKLSGAIIPYRGAFLSLLAPHCSHFYGEIAGNRENMEIKYNTVSTVPDFSVSPSLLEEQLSYHMEQMQGAEKSTRTCLSGIHKDDFSIEIDGRSAKSYASQGQTRSCALALKFAERQLFFEDSGQYPVLLLDDVLSELDRGRQDYIIKNTAQGQTIITCCEPQERFDEKANKIYVSHET